MDCVVCHGERGRARRSDGSATCLHDGCKRDYAKRRRGSNDDGDNLLAEKLPKEPRHECRKIKDVLGVSLCLTSGMASEERRIGRKHGDDDIQCEVRGGFGGARDKVEDLIPDTRWVKLVARRCYGPFSAEEAVHIRSPARGLAGACGGESTGG